MRKKVIASMPKPYSIAPFVGGGRAGFLVAAEKAGPCVWFDLDGNALETVNEGPGGVMTMAQLPGSDDSFMMTQRFYSPNDSKEASLVIARRAPGGAWDFETFAALPHVHRFGFVQGRDGAWWLVAATLCSGRDFKDDWSHPGKVYACRWPAAGDALAPVLEGLTRNHGYCRTQLEGEECVVVASDSGVHRLVPPAGPGEAWRIDPLLDVPASDVCFVDFEGNGRPHMVVFRPFHGDKLEVYAGAGGAWKRVWAPPEPMPFLHAIWPGRLGGRPVAFVGHREGARRLMALTMENGACALTAIDEGRGPANAFSYQHGGVTRLVATNRETDETAMYDFA